MAALRSVLLWLVDNVPMGRLAPWAFGLAIGRRPDRPRPDGGREGHRD